jgi:hypothetical protein
MLVLPERCHGLGWDNARFMPVPLCGTGPIVRSRARLKGDERWLLFPQELRKLLSREKSVGKLFASTGYDRDLDDAFC